ncbi:MAG: hypothetical protein H8E44_39370 [Planctomycetes bacterium]|nr:hypothetical protein [Planctomycetota bacterium]MBL7042430.1 hypothetical protein [Pirellulaceae bacterium]
MQDEMKPPSSAESGSEKRNDRMPKRLVAVAVLHVILALGLGCNGLQLALRWHELTFGEVMIMLLCIPASALSAVSALGLWLRKPYGLVAALFVGWVVAIGAGILFLVFAALFLHTFINGGYMADVFMAMFATCGLFALGVFAVNGWSMIYLRRAKIRELFDAKRKP